MIKKFYSRFMKIDNYSFKTAALKKIDGITWRNLLFNEDFSFELKALGFG